MDDDNARSGCHDYLEIRSTPVTSTTSSVRAVQFLPHASLSSCACSKAMTLKVHCTQENVMMIIYKTWKLCSASIHKSSMHHISQMSVQSMIRKPIKIDVCQKATQHKLHGTLDCLSTITHPHVIHMALSNYPGGSKSRSRSKFRCNWDTGLKRFRDHKQGIAA